MSHANDPMSAKDRRGLADVFCVRADMTLARIHEGELRGVIVIHIGSDVSAERSKDICERIRIITDGEH